ncbi:hypothetical protein KHS38_11930 [Mucilaginibacter sp. Bleaf8]|uniref:hypothetical protein n=1 Tax=Mucilaginibacter sp. Bleaf8 TaxID=2834430 RepID=UPI001BCCB5EF|nr:hypothetical protein [Mucilaginibacter sp. Bleaf8]MBS7565115.1 hypothetical protein [Mucilaginibacter sp. Bleaf8]
MAAENKPLTPINYVPYITEYSWWRSKSGQRIFVIVRIVHEFADEACKEPPIPTLLHVLERFTQDPEITTWETFVRHIEAGEMIKLKSETNQST